MVLEFLRIRAPVYEFNEIINSFFKGLYHIQFRMKAQVEYNQIRINKLKAHYENELDKWQFSLS